MGIIKRFKEQVVAADPALTTQTYAGLSMIVQAQLEALFATQMVQRTDLDAKCYMELRALPELTALQVLAKFGEAQQQKGGVKNQTAFFLGIIKRFRSENVPQGGGGGAGGAWLGMNSSFHHPSLMTPGAMLAGVGGVGGHQANNYHQAQAVQAAQAAQRMAMQQQVQQQLQQQAHQQQQLAAFGGIDPSAAGAQGAQASAGIAGVLGAHQAPAMAALTHQSPGMAGVLGAHPLGQVSQSWHPGTGGFL